MEVLGGEKIFSQGTRMKVIQRKGGKKGKKKGKRKEKGLNDVHWARRAKRYQCTAAAAVRAESRAFD